ncbi:MAG: 1-acyl-sn-glycerol-3-phosphate acyltransferase, partial [Planctomycetales bacterium]|nr:1-acyl-sn-glycerol-3-phosphate acyltransferase [Planctomycetales bacterium]
PLLLSANHPSSLLDPVIVGLASRRPVRFFAKAPLFETPILGVIMRALVMIPAYRGQDDRAQVKKNLESLERGIELLAQGEAVGIFPEGKSHDLERVEMVRGGAARMALQAAKRAPDLQVVPIGLNYEKKERFFSSIWVQVGQPILMREWIEMQSVEVEKQLSRLFTAELEARMREVSIHLQDYQYHAEVDDLELLAPLTSVEHDALLPALHRRKRITDAINYFAREEPDTANRVLEQLQGFRKQVERAGLKTSATVLRCSSLQTFVRLLTRWVGLTLLLPVALVGTAFHAIPFVIVRVLAARATPPGRTAISLYRLLFGLPVYGLWYVVTIVVGLRLLPWPLVVGLLVALPVSGVIALGYWITVKLAARSWWSESQALLRPGVLRHLVRQRSDLCTQLQELAQRFLALEGDRPTG